MGDVDTDSAAGQARLSDGDAQRVIAGRLRARSWTIAGGYAVIASLWIVFSDRVLAALVTDPDLFVLFGSYKGLFFVLTTAGLLHLVIRRAFDRLARTYAQLAASEQEVARRGRLYAARSAINQTIAHRPDRDGLFSEACRALVDDGGFAMAWIGRHDAVTGSVHPVADYGDESGYLHEVIIRSDDTPAGQGPSSVAIRQRRIAISNDIVNDPAVHAAGDAAHTHGWRSTASLPLYERGAVIGVLCVYARNSGFFQDQERRLLEEVAADLSYAIENQLRDAERRQAEAALRALNATLEERVGQRTEALHDALVRAEAADEVKSQFLATMSHELRTPLNSIIGFTGIILQGLAGPLTDEQTKQLSMVKVSARHLLALINDVLDISKIEAGELNIRQDDVEVDSCLEQVLETVRPSAEAKKLELVAASVQPLGTIVTDARRLEQILLNLLSNAIKFTDTGEVRLVARRERQLHREASSQDRLVIEVNDTGIGIAPDELASLFQPFRQIDAGMNRRHDGTGLGLAICRQLATLMHGTVEAHSTPGVGSTFTLTLPAGNETVI